MKSFISRSNHTSLYYQIQEIIKEEYLGPDKPPGTKIPSERKLLKRFKVSRGTVRKAIDGLEAEDLVYRVQGQGVFKRASADIKMPINSMVKYADLIASYGMQPGVRYISAYRIPASPQWINLFDLSANDELVQMKKIYTGDDKPVIYLINSIPVPIMGEELADDLCNDQSLAEPVFGFLLNSCGVKLDYMIAQIRPGLAGNSPFPIKEFSADTACQVIDNIGFDEDQLPVHRSELFMPYQGVSFQLYRKVPPEVFSW
jgi:GntR family transcriptional regulator